ncbi:hypothetical protein GGTG_05355 [Gaeumannomyces tritici R3-111a-1]|uniref:Uncharacterized protein n=1 Tax=Gaeumannomyces tritici (strain R3-111a-1) TaxID=644352 RepID=J3NVP2_GAET3|nr:hypothetical protein GGTG_05355 [Gaeumannomyces tritici R3-111a-1]EJT75420.1 hypothetical protein GGTG_05355 [Gaeumannomyces tritici R3-111a-1]
MGIEGGRDLVESKAVSLSGHSSSSSSAISTDPEIEAEDGAAGDSVYKSPISSVKEALDRLYRMASLIRKPPSSSENVRVNQFLGRLRQKPTSEELLDVETQLKDIEDYQKLRQGAGAWIVTPRFQPRAVPVKAIEQSQPTTRRHTQQQARQQPSVAPS